MKYKCDCCNKEIEDKHLLEVSNNGYDGWGIIDFKDINHLCVTIDIPTGHYCSLKCFLKKTKDEYNIKYLGYIKSNE